MEQYKQEFIEFMVDCKVLKFGDFTLKSGRKSPFFMNAGGYVTGYQLRKLGEYYAKAAGGFDNNARKNRAFVIYMNGMVASGMSAEIRPGCIVIIPSKAYREPVKWNEVISMLSSTASVSAVVLSAINLATK